MKGKGWGWKGESRRHSLARRGIKTAHGRRDAFTQTKTKPTDRYYIDPDILPPLEDFELLVYPDDRYDEEEGLVIEGWKYAIRTEHDSSVGIFGTEISPTFDSMEDLKIWWLINGEKALDIWFNSDLEGQAFWDHLENSLSGKLEVQRWKDYHDTHEQGKRYAETGDPRVFRKDSRLEVLKSKGNPSRKEMEKYIWHLYNDTVSYTHLTLPTN